MIKQCGFLLLLFAPFARPAVLLDRIAVIVGRTPILDSDITTDIRVTAFLNRTPLDFSPASRKQSAGRLIDQVIIRQQIQLGGFPIATRAETDSFLTSIEHSRAASVSQFRSALSSYGISEPVLRDRLHWQLTILRFIDAMFRPQVVVSETDIENFYESHRAALSFKSIAQVRPAIVETITGERINTLFDAWLETNRKSARIVFLESALT